MFWKEWYPPLELRNFLFSTFPVAIHISASPTHSNASLQYWGKGRKKCVPKSTFWQTYPIVQLPVRAAVAGAEQFPYPISFDFLPSSSCHGCDCDAIPTRPFLKIHEEGLAWNLSTNQMQNVDLQSGQKFLDTTCTCRLSRFSGRHQYLCVQNVVCHSWQNRVPRE